MGVGEYTCIILHLLQLYDDIIYNYIIMYIYICDYIEFIIYIDRYIHYKYIYIYILVVQ